MNIPAICKLISSNLSHNLRFATSDDERLQHLSLALQELGDKVIPALNRLLDEKDEGDPAFDEARLAALDLATFVCLDYIRKCVNYRWGISFLEEIAANCREPQLNKKLVIYTNQLKKKWNIDEPGGIAHTPRAKRLRSLHTRSTPGNILRIALLLASALYFFIHFDLTSLIFPRWNEPRQPESSVQSPAGSQNIESLPSGQPAPAQPPTEGVDQPLSQSAAGFYSYTDEQGVVHIVDDVDRVPDKYRKSMTVTKSNSPRSDVTTVVIKGNQVLVPVRLSYRGRSTEALLLLDTGSTTTTINEKLATMLGIAPADTKQLATRVADGRSVASYGFVAETIAVGSRSLNGVQTTVLAGSGGEGHDGLLGMNFLKNFRYHVDFNRGVIEWGG